MTVKEYINKCEYDGWGGYFFYSVNRKGCMTDLAKYSPSLLKFEANHDPLDHIAKFIVECINHKIGLAANIEKLDFFDMFLRDGLEYNSGEGVIYIKNGDDLIEFIVIRGWSRITNIFNTIPEAVNFQNKIGQFITDAINEHYKLTTNEQ